MYKPSNTPYKFQRFGLHSYSFSDNISQRTTFKVLHHNPQFIFVHQITAVKNSEKERFDTPV